MVYIIDWQLFLVELHPATSTTILDKILRYTEACFHTDFRQGLLVWNGFIRLGF